MGALLQSGKVGGGRRGLGLEKSHDWVSMELLLLLLLLQLLLMMKVVLLVMMMVQVVMMVVKLQRHPVVTQPVLGGLGQGLKTTSDHRDRSLSLHEFLDGRAVLGRMLLLLTGASGTRQRAPDGVPAVLPDCLSSNRSPRRRVWTADRGASLGGRAPAGVHRVAVFQGAGHGRARHSLHRRPRLGGGHGRDRFGFG